MTSTRSLLHETADLAAAYLDGLARRRVPPAPDAVAALDGLGGPLPDGPSDPADTLRLLDRLGSPATMASAGGRYFGFVIGGALPATLATNWLAGAWDQNAGMVAASPVSARIEQVASAWLREIFGLPASTRAAFVTGATTANFTGLAAGRGAVLRAAGWDVESDGLFGAPPITVIVGGEAHATVHKALAMLGLGRGRVVTVPVDGQGRLRADALPVIAGPTIVCLQAGNVNTGAFDPGSVVARAREKRAWVHVDGAFGLWAAASPARAHLLDGLADADSLATDAHKWLNVPYDSGIAFVRDPEPLRAAFSMRAAYLVQATDSDPMDYTPESSRRARGVEVWAALRSLGRAGLRDLVERTCRQAARFAEGLSTAGYEVLNEVALNQVLVSFGPDAVTRRAIQLVQEDGTCWCGGTTWQGRAAMRISVSSWATTDEDVDASLQAMLKAAARARAEA